MVGFDSDCRLERPEVQWHCMLLALPVTVALVNLRSKCCTKLAGASCVEDLTVGHRLLLHYCLNWVPERCLFACRRILAPA